MRVPEAPQSSAAKYLCNVWPRQSDSLFAVCVCLQSGAAANAQGREGEKADENARLWGKE